MSETVNKLIEKSKEAFIMAIEIYNKPSIKYRVEGFSFFICNAWELMLKAHIINKYGEASIYHADNPNRSIGLGDCVKKIFTNKNTPLRKNLEKIIELRNTSTHFITEEYEMVYIPLFQACVFNYTEKLSEFHNVDITEMIPNHFLTLSVKLSIFDEDEIRVKYPEQIAQKIIDQHHSVSETMSTENSNFAIRIEHDYYITKDRNKASAFIKIDNSAQESARLIKTLQDPNNTHQYKTKQCIEQINAILKRDKIDVAINNSNFQDFCRYYSIKENKRFCYADTHYSQIRYYYSYSAIEFISQEIRKDFKHILQKIRQKNKSTPGAKEF